MQYVFFIVNLVGLYLLWQQNRALAKQIDKQKKLTAHVSDDKKIEGVIYAD